MKTAFITGNVDLRPSAHSETEFAAPEGYPAVLAGALERAAGLGHGVVYLDGAGGAQEESYGQLLEQAARVLTGLRAEALVPGQPVIFQFEHNRDFVTAFWACLLGGFVPVPLSLPPTYEQPHNVLAKLRNVWDMLGRPLVLSSPALTPRLRGFATRESLEGFRVTDLAALRTQPPATRWHASQPDDLTLLLLTSGSTGLPKAVRHTHRTLLRWAASVARACNFSSREVSLNWMPLDHVGGLVMFHLRDVILGCRQIHAPTEPVLQRPLAWLDWIDRYRVTVTWAPNFAFGLVNEQADEIARGRWDLSSLHFIINAGEAIVSRTARRFLALLQPHGLPPTAMRPVWGMSETSSSVTFSRRFTLDSTRDTDSFVEVGEPMPGVELRIVDADNRPVPDGKIGRLQIRGVCITPGYHHNPEANQKSYTPDGWFITGDLGLLRDEQLSITGREKDVIIINGANFYSHEIESTVETLPGVEVSFTAACAIRRPDENTDRIAVFFCPSADHLSRLPELLKAIRSSVARKEGVSVDFILPLVKEDIPKTAIGKIQRSLLRQRFENGDFNHLLQPQADEAHSGLFTRVWREAPLPAATLAPASRILILADADGMGLALRRKLRAAGHACVVAWPGAGPRPDDVLPIEPDAQQDYGALLRAGPFTHLVHAWTYPRDKDNLDGAAVLACQETGGLALLRLLRAAAPAGEGAPVRLVIASSRTQAVADAEPIDYAKAPLLGLARTLPHEYTRLTCSHLDLPGIDAEADAEQVLAELAAATAGEAAVRDGRRLAPFLRTAAPVPAAGEDAFRADGFYVLSGGLGGIGRTLAGLLAGRHRARLLLLGRTPLPAAGADVAGADRRDALRELERAGAEVQYEAGDLTDPHFVAAAVQRAAQRWHSAPAGVLHLAGEYHIAPLAEESDAALRAALAPKLLGAMALQQATASYPDCWYVHFSSVLSVFSAYGTGAYTAANAALDAFARHQHGRGRRSRVVLWSLWRDIGMGSGEQTAANAQALGYGTITAEQGLALIERQLRSPEPWTIARLDPANRTLQRMFDPADPALVFSAEETYTAPRTETERKLVALWQEVLGVQRVGVRDNFFELGGRSLLAVKLFTQVERIFGRKLPLATLYKAATIEALAGVIDGPGDLTGSYILAIQPRGSRTPFFCIPGGGSDMIMFQELAGALGEDQPFFGLQASELDTTKEGVPAITLVEAATQFLAEMRRVQPRGPYRIGGHCFGGVIAFEMAQQLKAQGETVSFLAMIDSMVGDGLPSQLVATLGDKIALHRSQMAGLSLRGKMGYLVGKVVGFRRSKQLQREWHAYVARFEQIQQGYVPRPYDGRITIFKAADAFYYNRHPEHDARLYWQRWAQRGTDVFTVPGDHMTLFQAPHVADLARHLDQCLRATEAAPAVPAAPVASPAATT